MLQHIGPIILAGYFTLGIKWYPGWVDLRLCFQEPLRVLFRGFVEYWPNPGHITLVSRPVWAVLLFPLVFLVAWAFFRFCGWKVVRFAGQALGRTFRPGRESLQLLFRALVLAVFVNLISVPWNRAVGHLLTTDTIHNVVTYGLFPLSVCIGLIYFGSVWVVRAVLYFMNIFCVPPRQPPAILASAGLSSPYDYDGFGSEIFRFLVLMFVLILVIGVVTPLISRYRRTSRGVMVLLCLLLGVFTIIGVLNPDTLR